ncbi:aminoglycoside adenylyltransferase [Paenibacillus sp. FSL R7-0273]|uniref:GNAT family N-acetyltransferase n=1 Tax=Paenibacillus sp. FSL R7-0273 TaxID=1536772 RepID=UPI0004F71C47|nr:GNAT family protein [Paenibacillus sp. FSL R7-0273]AIQ48465.1 aminoglycoside adenylyltransferase [Paenibacillus sp. FSL R7-0273]OMF86326.1 GNAT family N-acetyltransferase [Paenibacillus sp. FSL R7-0273]
MIRLEPFERSDFKQLIAWIDSPEFMVQWGGKTFSYPLTDQQLEHYINSDTLSYRVVYEENNEVIGHISLTPDPSNQSGRIGKVIVGNKNLQGLGIGQQMIRQVLDIAFGQLNVHRVSLGVFDFNYAAIACYEKAGFVKEGMLREARKVGNEFWNLWEMGILEQEWLGKKINN